MKSLKTQIRADTRLWLKSLFPYRVDVNAQSMAHKAFRPIEGWGRVGRQVWDRVHREPLGIFCVYDRMLKEVEMVGRNRVQRWVHRNARTYVGNLLGIQIVSLLDPIRWAIYEEFGFKLMKK